MAIKRIVITLSAALYLCLASAACNRSDPEPQFPKVMSDDGTTLLPIKLTIVDKGILGSAASTEGGARPESSDSGDSAEKVTIDDSTAEGAAKGFLASLQACKHEDVMRLVVPDQKEEFQKLQEALQPVSDARQALVKVVAEKFPGHAIEIAILKLNIPAEVQITEVKVDDSGETAEATLEVPGEVSRPLKLHQTDGKWRVEIPNLSTTAIALSGQPEVIGQIAAALQSVTAAVERSQISDVEALDKAVANAAKGVAPEDGGGSSNTAQPSSEEQPADSAANAPKPRQRDEVDEAYSGPGMLRAR